MTDLAKILVALGSGAVGAAALGLIGAWIGRRSEHKKWLREERLEAYRDFLRVVEIYASLFRIDDPSEHVGSVRAMAEEFVGGTAGLRLLGPEQVAEAGMVLHSRVAELISETKKSYPAVEKARHDFIEVARKALKVADLS